MDTKDKKYVVMTEIKNDLEVIGYQEEYGPQNTETVRLFDSFEEAKKAMRISVKEILTSAKDVYDYDEYDDGITMVKRLVEEAKNNCNASDNKKCDSLASIIYNTITNPDYECETVDGFNIGRDDICYCEEEDYRLIVDDNVIYIRAIWLGELEMNIHNMRDVSKNYLFKFSPFDEGHRCYTIRIKLMQVND